MYTHSPAATHRSSAGRCRLASGLGRASSTAALALTAVASALRTAVAGTAGTLGVGAEGSAAAALNFGSGCVAVGPRKADRNEGASLTR